MRRRYSSRGNKKYIGHIIAISLLALVVAYPMGKYFETLLIRFGGETQPTITNPKGGEDVNVVEEGTEVILKAREIILIQNGVFSTLGGAQTHGQNLQESEFEAILIEDDVIRVITGLYLDKDSPQNNLSKQRELGFDNFLAEYIIPETLITIKDNDEDTKAAVELTLLIFEEVLEKTHEYFLTGEVKTLSNHSGLDEIHSITEQKILNDILQVISKYDTWTQTSSNQDRNEYFTVLFSFIKGM